MSERFKKFKQYLIEHGDETFKLSMKEIEDIIERSLPQEAYKYLDWWSNNKSYPLSKIWIEKGYYSKKVVLGDYVVLEKLKEEKLIYYDVNIKDNFDKIKKISFEILSFVSSKVDIENNRYPWNEIWNGLDILEERKFNKDIHKKLVNLSILVKSTLTLISKKQLEDLEKQQKHYDLDEAIGVLNGKTIDMEKVCKKIINAKKIKLEIKNIKDPTDKEKECYLNLSTVNKNKKEYIKVNLVKFIEEVINYIKLLEN